MKKKLFVSLMIMSLVLVSAGFGAFAATNLEEIKANLNKGIGFVVNGKEWIPKDQKGNVQYAISYKGSTYVPLRAAGDALGVEVGWDGKNNKVHLGEGAAAVEGKTTTTTTTTPTNNLSITINNVTAAIDKVVQDNDSLKLYVTYINNSDEPMRSAESLTKVVANGKQYEYDSDFNFDRYYQKDVDNAPSSIEPGVTAKSVIFFPPIENAKTINIVLSPNFEDYRFNNVKVE